MSRLLVIDGQVFQTPAWHRGMGKYSYELVKALTDLNSVDKHWTDIKLILTTNLPLDSDARERLSKLNLEVEYLNLKTNEFDNRPVADHNRSIIDRYITKCIHETKSEDVDYIVCSLMQSEIAPAFSSLGSVKNAVILYDLIPYMYRDIYLHDALAEKSYMSKFFELMKADIYMAISKTVANDVILYTNAGENRVVSIDGGPIAHATKSDRIDVPEPFILMPTGDDLRKNNKRGVEGFDIFNKQHSEKYSLVITSHFTDAEKKMLSSISDKVIFTDNISGEKLNYLYEKTDALLFPSEYEGLGMPILEALEKGTPVACSNISVFREMSTDVFHYFRHEDTRDIADALQRALTYDTSTKDYIKTSLEILSRYSWTDTTHKFIRAFEIDKPKQEIKHNLAIYAPEAGSSLLGNYVQRIYTKYSNDFHMEYCLEGNNTDNRQTSDYLSIIGNTRRHDDDEPIGQIPIFHLANDHCIKNMMAALARPGIVFLHELDLTVLWENLLQKNFVSQARYDVEKRLSMQFCFSGASFIVSLLSLHKRIAVSSTKEASTLRRIATKCSIDPSKIIVVEEGLSQLPYPEIIMSPSGSVLCVSNLVSKEPEWFSTVAAPIKKCITTSFNNNEFEFVNAIASSSVVLIDTETISFAEAEIICVHAEQSGIRNIAQVGDRYALDMAETLTYENVDKYVESVMHKASRKVSARSHNKVNKLRGLIEEIAS